MAHFYDSMDDREISKIESLLQRGGIMYSLRVVESGSRFKEIQVAEEDLAEAEQILSSGN